MIRFDPRVGHESMPDIAMGLAAPSGGRVLVRGRQWSALPPGIASQWRGSIGRFFGDRRWIHHLDVDENVTLRQRHHTADSLEAIAVESNRLAAAMGLAQGVPAVRPAGVDPRVLQRAACVRMLLETARRNEPRNAGSWPWIMDHGLSFISPPRMLPCPVALF